jgi:hypothetical protein
VKRAILSTTLVALSIGCGGGGGGGIPTVSLSGVVAIGYHVQDAVVFLDLNDDNVMDSEDRRVATDADGRFTLTGLFPEDVPVHQVVALVHATSIRTDTLQPVGFEARLAALPGHSDFVSPFSTLVVSEVAEDPTLAPVDAEAKVVSGLTAATQMPLTGQPLDLERDYVVDAAAGTPTSPDSVQLQRVATTVTEVLRRIVDTANASQSFVDCNESPYFHPIAVAIDQQLSAIADGTYAFSQLSAAAQADIIQNPQNYQTFFMNVPELADVVTVIFDAAADMLQAFLDWVHQQIAMLAAQVAADLAMDVGEALIEII